MVTIKFPDRDTEKRALAFLLGRFSGHVLRTGEHLVPESALEALADANIPFTIHSQRSTYEQTNQKAGSQPRNNPPLAGGGGSNGAWSKRLSMYGRHLRRVLG